ncbi:MAG: tRNA uridine-5-carboxymethylaminomethyl(34) synthesis GTPase MnmE [Kiloniellales bacterium]
MPSDGNPRSITSGLDSIFAPATARGRSALAVIRISGPSAGSTLDRLCDRNRPKPRRASLRHVKHPTTGEGLDQALVLWFPGPASATGEDVVELHLHGGPAVVAGLLDALSAEPGLRLAEPGEFARRAFANDKLDLTQIEGLADLVAAETGAQRRQALAQAEGTLSARLAAWREALLQAAALVEAQLDFSDEEIPDGLAARASGQAAAVAEEIRGVLARAPWGERLREGISCALLGAPNVGKSSLLNALAGRDAAIVTDRPGTTRDPIEVSLDLAGLPVTLIDTAGIARASQDPIEREGIRRSLQRAEQSDLALLVVDLSRSEALPDALAEIPPERRLTVGNKADLGPSDLAGLDLAMSAKTGAGLDRLLALLTDKAESLMAASNGEAALVSRARQRNALQDALEALDRGAVAPLPELFAEEIRLALRAFGRVAGRVDVEDVLDRLFGEFCIGK